MILDTLEIKFSADIAPVSAALAGLSVRLGSVKNESASAFTQLRVSALNALSAIAGQAYDLGAQVGKRFAAGIISQKSTVSQATSSLSGSSSSSSGGMLSNLASTVSEALNNAKSKTSSSVSVPLVVDGVKLGEAVIKSVNSVRALSGRLDLNI